MADDVAGAGGGNFRNRTLGSANAGCAGVTGFWVLSFGVSHSASDSAIDIVSTMEIVGGSVLVSGGGGTVLEVVLMGPSMITALCTVYFAM